MAEMDNLHFLRFCRAYMQTQTRLGIRYSQLFVLNVLCTTPGPHTPMMLADLMRVSRPMVAAHLNALQDAGYITRVASPDDGRSVYILPTKKARAIIEKVNCEFDKVHKMLSEKMGTEQFQMLVRLIGLANDAMAADVS